MSNLHIIPGEPDFIRLSRLSLATKTESRICLPPIKAFWDAEISFDNTPDNLLAKTFAMILYILVTKLIGRKSLHSWAPGFFGIKARKVTLRLFTKSLDAWKSWKTLRLFCLNSRFNSEFNSYFWGPILWNNLVDWFLCMQWNVEKILVFLFIEKRKENKLNNLIFGIYYIFLIFLRLFNYMAN